MILLELYARFFLTGLFAVGGGFATIPFLQDMSETTGWFTAADLANMLAISESTPGAIGINMATYVGYMVAGIIGGIVATLGLVSPSIIIIVIIARILERFRQNKYVDYAFYGLRAASLGMITAAGLAVAELVLVNTDLIGSGAAIYEIFNIKSIILAIVIFLAMKKWNRLHPITFIAISAVIGIVFSFAGV